jgi:hypothetical protein
MSDAIQSVSSGGFVLPEGARVFFDYEPQRLFAKVAKQAGTRGDLILFDAYWACLCVGLLFREQDSAMEKDRFLVAYPDVYEPYGEYIAGLLVEAELAAIHTDEFTEPELERAIADLLKVSAPTRLSPKGLGMLNRYAAGGYRVIKDKMRPRPTDIPNFLIRYQSILDQVGSD